MENVGGLFRGFASSISPLLDVYMDKVEEFQRLLKLPLREA